MQNNKKITGYVIHLDKMRGKGAFGKVYAGQEDQTLRKVAIKVLEKTQIDQNQYYKNALFSEIQILKALKSPNIVGFLDVMESANSYYIIQQYCNGGELRRQMNKLGKIPEQQSIGLLKQICNGFVQLLKQGIMHRDLKPQNILIHDGILKIADFGLSKKQQNESMSNQSIVGTPLYMPVQILKGAPYSSKCDIWSLGFIFYEMLEGKYPWRGSSSYQLIQNIENQPLTFSSELSPITKDFLSRCLGVEEHNRFSWDQLLRHEIFKGHFERLKTKQFENKYKAIMNNLRFRIKTRNIDLQKYFSKIGYNRQNVLKYKNFKQLLHEIDEKLTQQQVKYTFNKMNESRTGQITFDQFQRANTKFGIPMTICRPNLKQPPQTSIQINNPQQVDSAVFKHQTTIKVANAFLKIASRLKQKKMTIYQVLNIYGCSQKGEVGFSALQRMMKNIDQSFTPQELETAYSLIDKKGNKEIPYQQFVIFYKKMINGNATSSQKVPSTNANTSFTSKTSTTSTTNTSYSSNKVKKVNSMGLPGDNSYGGNLFNLVPQQIYKNFAQSPIKKQYSLNGSNQQIIFKGQNNYNVNQGWRM